MQYRILATIVFAASLACGCGAPDLNAAETGAPVSGTQNASAAATPTPVIEAAVTPTDGQVDPRATTATPSILDTIAAATTVAASSTPTATTTPAPATTTAPANPLLNRVAKIHSIGDSMTAGNEIGPTSLRAWRGTLFQMLISAGYRVDMVGTQQLMPFVGGDPDHDGYGGAWIGPGGQANNLADRLPTILSAVDGDIIILALGWNSVYLEPSLAAQKYRDFVNRIATAKPNAHIIVATLSPQKGETEAQTTAGVPGYGALNAAARSLANASPTDRIHLADFAAAGFQTGEYWDVIHWLQPGADRAAGVLYRTIINGPLKR